MKVLQISCGVSYTNVYHNLFTGLKNKNINFKVYIPQHDNNTVSKITKKDFPFSFYSNKIIKSYDKFIYFTKIKRMIKDIEKNIDLSKISLIHAHSLFSDGAVAYEISKKYNIPYIVAVRDTDVNQYFRKAIHLRSYGLNIFKSSQNIIFLSKAYSDNVFEKYVPNQYKAKLLKKVKIIPNGIDNYWLDNQFNRHSSIRRKKIKLLFVGQIIKRKNLTKIIKSAQLLEKNYNLNVDLVLIGKKVDDKYFKKLINNWSFEYIPYLPKDKLISYYRDSDVFVMPSLTETFGLVYGEAMSQGLPVIYTRGQGFDKQFEEGEIGYSVDPHNPFDIAEKIKKVIDNRDELSSNCNENVGKFNWNLISREYKELYSNITQNIKKT